MQKTENIEGKNLYISTAKGKLRTLSAYFYTKGLSKEVELIDLSHKMKDVYSIIIETPNLIAIDAYNANVTIEQFKRVSFSNLHIIVEV